MRKGCRPLIECLPFDCGRSVLLITACPYSSFCSLLKNPTGARIQRNIAGITV